LKFYSWLVSFLTIVAFIIVGTIIFKYDPNQADFKILILFFSGLYFALAGLFTLLGNFIRIKINKNTLSVYFLTSFRQGLLISLALVGLLLLKMTNVLNLWDGILLVVAILLLELYFRTK